jgi:hypothetical protein
MFFHMHTSRIRTYTNETFRAVWALIPNRDKRAYRSNKTTRNAFVCTAQHYTETREQETRDPHTIAGAYRSTKTTRNAFVCTAQHYTETREQETRDAHTIAAPLSG